MNARSQVRALCGRIDLTPTEQLKVATCGFGDRAEHSKYAGSGKVMLTVVNDGKPGIEIAAEDNGPGIPHLSNVLAGRYVSKTGLGLGIRECQKLMDTFEIDTAGGRGTKILARKYR